MANQSKENFCRLFSIDFIIFVSTKAKTNQKLYANERLAFGVLSSFIQSGQRGIQVTN
jgi:hypothetical protein